MLKTITKRVARVPAERPGDLENLPSMPARQVRSRLLKYLRPYRRRMALTILIYMTCVTISQLYPFIDRILIDQHIAVNRIDQTFFLLVAGAAVLHAINYFGFGLRSISIVRISQDLLFDLRSQLFYHVEHLSFNFHESWPVGKTMSRFLSDISTLNDFLTNQMAALFNDATSAVIVIILMFIIDPGLAFIALVTLPVLFGLAAYLRPRIHK